MVYDNTKYPHRNVGNRLAVLVGWLGCKSKNLERYKDLYTKFGWDVIIKIPSPIGVLYASLMEENAAPKSKLSLESKDINTGDIIPTYETSNGIPDLAHNIIYEIYQSNCSIFVMHLFSNAGSFLWESMSHKLYDIDNHFSLPTEMSAIHDNVKNKLVGLVFDSAPANYVQSPDLLQKAMQYCSSEEKIQLNKLKSKLDRERDESKRSVNTIRDNRANIFWNYMTNRTQNRSNRVDVYELYLYSNDDLLTPSRDLQELIEHRQRQFGINVIWSRRFTSSPHCCHLLSHPSEYASKLMDFLRHVDPLTVGTVPVSDVKPIMGGSNGTIVTRSRL